jgi:hypothetical protein
LVVFWVVVYRQCPAEYWCIGCHFFQALVKLLPQLRREGHRPLIFSQWTSMLDILEWALDVTGFRYTRLDGRSGLVSIPSSPTIQFSIPLCVNFGQNQSGVSM